jgi:hypothetical protein
MEGLLRSLGWLAAHRGVVAFASLAWAFAFLAILRMRAGSRARGRALYIFVPGSLALAGCVVPFSVSALKNDGAARRAYVLAEKRAQADDGRLVLDARFGLVDRFHARAFRDHRALALAHLRDAGRRRGILELRAPGATVWGAPFDVVRRYHLADAARLREDDVEDAAAAVALQMAWDLEAAQDAAPWTSGLRMTAFAADDLPSALAVALGRNEADAVSARESLAAPPARAEAMAAARVSRYALPASATSHERTRFAQLRRARALWVGESPDPDAASAAAGEAGL